MTNLKKQTDIIILDKIFLKNDNSYEVDNKYISTFSIIFIHLFRQKMKK